MSNKIATIEVCPLFEELGYQRYDDYPNSLVSGARVRAERAAGKYLLDVYIAGSDTPTVTFLPNGWVDRDRPVIVAPEVVDRRKWKDGHLWYEDEFYTILRVHQYVFPELAVNTKFARPREVSTWKALLDPKWQGKVIA